jgi:hypothetical protein
MRILWGKYVLLVCAAILLSHISSSAQPKRSDFMGIKLRTEVQAYSDEIEKKTGKKIIGIFSPFEKKEEEGVLGVSFINEEDGIAYVGVKDNLEGQTKKLEAVIAHELLHLRQRVRGFPVFLWSPTVKTSKGFAQDVEQSNVNDLLSLIEHQVFRDEMEKLGLDKFLDLSKEAIQGAKKLKGTEDGQAESINFCRAILEFQNPKDLETYRKVFIENGWQTAIKIGEAMAEIIKQQKITTPAQTQAVFSRCLIKLYNTPRAFKFRRNLNIKQYRQMIIST